MAIAVPMPKVGISVESCVITEWLKQPGDAISVGEILFTYETDKASLECESPAEGVLLEIFCQSGDEVPVLQNVCAIGQAGEDTAALRPGGTDEVPSEEGTAANPVENSHNIEDVDDFRNCQQIQQISQQNGCILSNFKISPRARLLADSQHVDAARANPTGPYGRVIERDVRALIESGEGVYTSAAYGYAQGNIPGGGIGGKVTISVLQASSCSAHFSHLQV